MKKQFGTTLLAVVMVLAMLPLSALAEETGALQGLALKSGMMESGEGYTWDGKVLTLSGLDLALGPGDGATALSLPADAIIRLEAGSVNTVSSVDPDEPYGFCIAVEEDGGDLTIEGSGSLTVISGCGGIGVDYGNLAILGNPHLTVSAAQDGLLSSDWEGTFVLAGSPTLHITAGGVGIKAQGDAALGGGTVAIESVGDGIYVDGALMTVASCDLTIRAEANGISGSFWGSGGEDEGLSIFRSMLDIQAESCIVSGDGPVKVTDSTLDLRPNTGAALVAAFSTMAVSGGTLSSDQGAVGLDALEGVSLTGGARVELNNSQTIRSALTMTGGALLTLGADSGTQLDQDKPWTVAEGCTLRNDGGLENRGSLSVEGGFLNRGVYVHAAQDGLTGAGDLAREAGARVIVLVQDEDAVASLARLGTLTYAQWEPLDYTASPLPPDGDGYTWDAGTNTLTLDGAILLTEDDGPALRLPEDARLCLTPGSTSQISNTGTGQAIRAEGDLLLYGGGALTLRSGRQAVDAGDALTLCGVEISAWSPMGMTAGRICAADAALGIISTAGACLIGAEGVALDHVDAELYSPSDTVIRVPGAADMADAAARLTLIPMPEGVQLALPTDEHSGKYAALAAGEVLAWSLVLDDRAAHHVVFFEPENGTLATYQVAADRERATAPAAPSRSGYTFGGWYREKTCATLWSFDTDTVAADLTLYAKWTRNSSGGGGGSASNRPSAEVDGGGGTVKTGKGSVTITPDKGYQIAAVTVNGKEVEIPTDGRLTGLMRTDKVIVTFEKIPEELEQPTVDMGKYTDLDAGAWYCEAVRYVVEHGLFFGTSDTAFSPNAPMTRAMLMTVLARADGQDTTPVSGRWYDMGMKWAVEQGISDGTDPDGSITREQLAVMLYRYGGGVQTAGSLSAFSDGAAVSSWAADAMGWAVGQGILTGKPGGVLDPQGKASRAEVSAMLRRFIEASF